MKTIGDGGTPLTNVLSPTKDAVKTLSTSNALVEEGKAYSIRKTFSISSGATEQVLFDLSSVPENVKCEPFRISTTVGPLRVHLYTGCTATAGTTITVFNRLGLTSLGDNDLLVSETPTDVITPGYPLQYVVGLASTNWSSGGGFVAGEDEFILLAGDKVILELDNDEGAGETVEVSLQFDWFEGALD